MSTEENILHVAREIFYRKGLAGARMQEIADKAAINKAMLHYYFKTKEALFHRVFTGAFEIFSGRLAEVLNSDLSLAEKIRDYVHYTIDTLQQDPGIPVFVLNELTFNPDRLTELFAGKDKISLAKFREQVKTESRSGTDAELLFMDMVALCVYPFVIAPVFKKILQKTGPQYADLLQQRKEHIITQLLDRI